MREVEDSSVSLRFVPGQLGFQPVRVAGSGGHRFGRVGLPAERAQGDASPRQPDNYLHEAALAAKPPSGTVYDPERDGRPLASLGVHEHWNNAADRQYSRNLGKKEGIELVAR